MWVALHQSQVDLSLKMDLTPNLRLTFSWGGGGSSSLFERLHQSANFICPLYRGNSWDIYSNVNQSMEVSWPECKANLKRRVDYLGYRTFLSLCRCSATLTVAGDTFKKEVYYYINVLITNPFTSMVLAEISLRMCYSHLCLSDSMSNYWHFSESGKAVKSTCPSHCSSTVDWIKKNPGMELVLIS